MAEEKTMNCNDESDLKVEDCRLKQFERNKYFYGKLMTVSDFQLEQSYFNEKRHLINRTVHGVGVVCGLEVKGVEETQEGCNCGPGGEIEMVGKKWVADLSAGLALDCLGREVIVGRSGKHFISEGKIPDDFDMPFGLYIKRKDRLKSPVPSPANTSSCGEMCCYNRIEENFELVFDELPQIIKLGFDSTTYSTTDIATVFLIEPKGENNQPTRTVMLTSPRRSAPLPLVLNKANLSGGELVGADIFWGTVPLKEPAWPITDTDTDTEVAPAPTVVEPAARGDILGPIMDPSLIRTIRPTRFPGILSPGGTEPANVLPVNQGDKITVTYVVDNETYTGTAYARADLTPKIEKKRIADDYYKAWLKECACCEDANNPIVLLAVLALDGNEAIIQDGPTAWYRGIVYNNPMLYDLISCHILDEGAHSARAIERIKLGQNYVGNSSDGTVRVPQIELKAGPGVKLTPQDLINPPSGYGAIEIGVDSVGDRGMANSGLVSFREIPTRNGWVSPSIRHGAGGRDRTTPSIILGLWDNRNQRVKYMEDLSLISSLVRTVGSLSQVKDDSGEPPSTFKWIQRIINNDGLNPVFFKAINVTETSFNILVANFGNPLEEGGHDIISGEIRWWAIPSQEIDTLREVVLLSLAAKDSSGAVLETARVDKKTIISTKLKNNTADAQPFAVRIEITDKDGKVVLSTQKEGIARALETPITAEWTPDKKGKYTVKTFIFDKESKTKRSEIKTFQLEVV